MQRMGSLTTEEFASLLERTPVASKAYDRALDREARRIIRERA
jgi:hypothetical protein